MLTEDLNKSAQNTSGTNSGGIGVSTDPVPLAERIKQARQQIYKSLQTDKFSFSDFNNELDDEEYRDQIIEKLAQNPKLKEWDLSSLQSALLEGKLKEVSLEGSENTSETSSEPLEPSQNSNVEELRSLLKDPTRWVQLEDGQKLFQSTKEEEEKFGGAENIAMFLGDNYNAFYTSSDKAVQLTPMNADITAYNKHVFGEDEVSKSNMDNLSNSVAQIPGLFNQSVYGTLEGLYDLAAVPQNYLADLLGADWLKANWRDFSEDTPLELVNQVVDSANESVNYYQDQIKYKEDDIISSFNNGNYSDAGTKIASGILTSIPSMVSLYMTGGVSRAANLGKISKTAVNAMPFLGTQYQEIKDNPELSDSAKPVIALANALAEVIPTQSFGTGKLIDDIVSGKAGLEQVKGTVRGFMGKIMNSNGIPMTMARGSAEEVVTQFSQNLINKYSGVNPDLDLRTGLLDAGIIGGIADGALGGGAKLMSSKSKAKVDTLTEEIDQLKNDLSNPELPATVQETLQNQLETKTEEVNSELENSQEVTSKMTPEVFNRVSEISKEMDSISNTLNENQDKDSGLSETAVKSLETRRKELSEELDKIIEDQTKQTNEQDQTTVAEEATETGEGTLEEQGGQTEELVIEELKTPTFFQTLTDGESRTSRLEELKSRLSESINNENLGIAQDPKQKAKEDLTFLRDLTEYAVLSIADGTVKTADAFKNLAKGIRDFGDDVINKAYYAAQDVVKEYQKVNSGTTDQAIGNVLTKMQDLEVTREPAKTKITPKEVKAVTDGGTQGVIKQTIKKANKEYYATLEKGAKLGIREAKRASKEYSSKLSTILKDYYKNSPNPLGKVMSNTDLSRISKRLATATKDSDIDGVLAVLDKVTSKAENAKLFDSYSKLKAIARSKAKSTNIPANIQEVFGRFATMDTIDLFRSGNQKLVQDVYDRLSELNTLVKPGTLYKGNIADLGKLNNSLKALADKLESERFDRELPKLEEHINKLAEVLEVTVDSPTDYTDYRVKVLDLESQINEAGLAEPKTKSKSRETNEIFISNNLELLSDVDLSEFTQDEQKAIQSLMALTDDVMADLSDVDLVKVAIALPNIINNGRLDGVGSVAAKINSHLLAKDESFTKPVKNALAEIPALGKLVASVFKSKGQFNTAMRNIMSTSQRMDTLFKDAMTKGKFLSRFGIQGYKEGRNVAQRLYEKSQKDFGDLVKNDADVREFMRSKDRGAREIKLGIFAWFNQMESGLTEDQKQQLFERKMNTLKGMKESLDPSKGYRFDWRERANKKVYIDNLLKAIEDVSEATNINELESKVGKGEMKVYQNSVDLFSSLRPEFLANARLYNNVDLDTNIDNYTPIDYMFFEDVANTDLLNTSYDRAFSSTKISGRSGSKSSKDRIIKDGSLPKEGLLDFNFITNTFKNYGLQLADIHTQGSRMQIHHNLANKQLKEAINGVNFFGTVNTMMTEEMQVNYQYFNSPRSLKISDKLKRAIITSTYGRALGGFGQAIKQFVPMMSDALIRTGDFKTMAWYMSNSGKVAKFMADQDISRRGVQSSQMGSSVTNDVDVGELKNSVLRNLDSALEFHEKVVNKVVLGPLRLGDVHGARMSWMMYYNQYASKNNIAVDLDSKPNPEAAAYADNMVDISGNTSVDSNKAKFTQTGWAKMLFPFSGAALTSLVNMGVNTSKLITAIQTKDAVNARYALNAMTANTIAIVAFQTTGFAIRWGSYLGLQSLAEMAIEGIDLDDEDEENKLISDLTTMVKEYTDKRVQRNIENSTYYLANDLVHRGLLSQGPAEAFSDMAIKPMFQKLTGFNISSYRSSDPSEAFYNTLGIYGVVPAGVHSLFNKNSNLFSTREQELKNAGYGAYLKADGTYGYELPDGKKMPENLRLFNKAMNVLSIPAAFGIQDQLVSSITRTAPRLYQEMEEIIYKDVPKVSDVNKDKKFENKFKEINYQGKSMKLSTDEAKLFRKYYDQAYKESYQEYVDSKKDYLGDGPKMQELAIKYLYKKAKDKLVKDPDFKKSWELKAKKSK